VSSCHSVPGANPYGLNGLHHLYGETNMKLVFAVLSLALAAPILAQDDITLMTARDLMTIPVERPDHVIRYGIEPSQFGELRLPDGNGRHPVVVLVHGGCWSSYAGAASIGAMADALKKKGIATWSIEYRRLPEKGSGWPGTYRDTSAAIDFLRTLAPRHRLDLSRVVFVGHSAGGHLALWAASRSRLRYTSPLYTRNPLIPAGVVNLAGRMDMAEGIEAYEATCDAPVVRQLLGGMPADVPDRYADTSPEKLLPLGIPQVMIWGSRETYVPAPQAERYAAAGRRAGDDVRLIIVPQVGHFETASPQSAAWPTVLDAIETLLARRG
jgi:acetyl esterase/lipase